jgi:WD40 repeat protein
MTATRVADASAARASGPAYAAFISYNRDMDGRLAPRLENALERFATPWYRLRAFRVFRDDASLSSNSGLRSSLNGALDGVGHFILLASPGAAQSVWVGREVEYWVANHGSERMLLVLTGGEIVWDEAAGDFDWERTTALPRTISGAFTEEPRYTDMRFAGHTDQITVRDPRFRAAVADIAAPLHGIAKDDLIGEEVRQHRRAMRIARAAGVALALLTAAASVAAVLAIRSAGRADRERDRAEREGQLATSRQLAAQSTVALQGDDIDGALTQAVHAWRTARTGEARDALLAGLKSAAGIEGSVKAPRPAAVAFSGDRRKLALVGADHRVTLVDLPTRRLSTTPVLIPRPNRIAGLALDAHGARLAVGYDGGAVDLWDLAGGPAHRLAGPAHHVRPPRGLVLVAPHPPAALPVFSADGTRLAWAGPTRQISVWDGRHVRRLVVPGPLGEVPWDVALSADGRYLAAARDSDKLLLWPPGARRPRVIPGAGAFVMTAEGQHGPIALGGGRAPVLAAAGYGNGQLDLWNAATGRRIRHIGLPQGDVDALAFSPHGGALSVVDRRAVAVFDRTGARLGAVPPVGAEHGAAALDERGQLATIGKDGLVTVRAVGHHQVGRALDGASTFTELAFDPTSRRIAALGRDSRVRLWDVSGGRPVGPPVTGPVDPDELAFLPDGRLLTCCARPRIWDAGGGGLRGEQPPAGPGSASSIGVTARGQLVIARSGRRTYTIFGAGDPLRFHTGDYLATVSPDGHWAEVPTAGGDLELWNLDRRRKTASLPELGLVSYSPTVRSSRRGRHRST